MKMTKLARPYAQAAFEYAHTHEQLASWSEMLQTIATVIEQPMIIKLLHNPQYSSEEFADICMQLCAKKLKQKLQQQYQNFIKLLAINNRLLVLPDIAVLFERYRSAVEKTLDVEVVTVVPLNDAYKQKLTKLLSEQLKHQVILHCKTDANLLGGMLIRAGDKVIDYTVKGQILRLKNTLMQ